MPHGRIPAKAGNKPLKKAGCRSSLFFLQMLLTILFQVFSGSSGDFLPAVSPAVSVSEVEGSPAIVAAFAVIISEEEFVGIKSVSAITIVPVNI